MKVVNNIWRSLFVLVELHSNTMRSFAIHPPWKTEESMGSALPKTVSLPCAW